MYLKKALKDKIINCKTDHNFKHKNLIFNYLTLRQCVTVYVDYIIDNIPCPVTQIP